MASKTNGVHKKQRTPSELCEAYCDLLAPDGPWLSNVSGEMATPSCFVFESPMRRVPTEAVLRVLPLLPATLLEVILDVTPTQVQYNFAVGQAEVLVDRAQRNDVIFDEGVAIAAADSDADAVATAFRSTLKSRANRNLAVDTHLPIYLARACVGVISQVKSVAHVVGKAAQTGLCPVEFDNELDVYSLFMVAALQPFDCANILNMAAAEFIQRCNNADAQHTRLANCPVDVVMRRARALLLASARGDPTPDAQVYTQVRSGEGYTLRMQITPKDTADSGSSGNGSPSAQIGTFDVVGVEPASAYALGMFIFEAYTCFFKRAALVTFWLEEAGWKATDQVAGDRVEELRRRLTRWESHEVAEARATALKDGGNARFNAGAYREAIDLYTQAVLTAPAVSVIRAVLLTNRAVARTKLATVEFAELAIADCTQAVAYDPVYWKAYYRRALAALEMVRLTPAEAGAFTGRGVNRKSILVNAIVDLAVCVYAAPRSQADDAAVAALKVFDDYRSADAVWAEPLVLSAPAIMTCVTLLGDLELDWALATRQELLAGLPMELDRLLPDAMPDARPWPTLAGLSSTLADRCGVRRYCGLPKYTSGLQQRIFSDMYPPPQEATASATAATRGSAGAALAGAGGGGVGGAGLGASAAGGVARRETPEEVAERERQLLLQEELQGKAGKGKATKVEDASKRKAADEKARKAAEEAKKKADAEKKKRDAAAEAKKQQDEKKKEDEAAKQRQRERDLAEAARRKAEAKEKKDALEAAEAARKAEAEAARRQRAEEEAAARAQAAVEAAAVAAAQAEEVEEEPEVAAAGGTAAGEGDAAPEEEDSDEEEARQLAEAATRLEAEARRLREAAEARRKAKDAGAAKALSSPRPRNRPLQQQHRWQPNRSSNRPRPSRCNLRRPSRTNSTKRQGLSPRTTTTATRTTAATNASKGSPAARSGCSGSSCGSRRWRRRRRRRHHPRWQSQR
jgi:hypothetical protein